MILEESYRRDLNLLVALQILVEERSVKQSCCSLKPQLIRHEPSSRTTTHLTIGPFIYSSCCVRH